MRILFLRDNKNRTIVDCQVEAVQSRPEYENQNGHVELHSLVCIDAYTDLLMENLQYANVLKDIFTEFQELRGWLWEWYLPNSNNRADKYDDVLHELRKKFAGFAHQINDLCEAGVFVVED